MKLPATTLAELGELAAKDEPFTRELYDLFTAKGAGPGPIRHRIHVGRPREQKLIFDGMLNLRREKFGIEKEYENHLKPRYGIRGKQNDFVIEWKDSC